MSTIVPIPPPSRAGTSLVPSAAAPSAAPSPATDLAEANRQRIAQENAMLDQLHASVMLTQARATGIGAAIREHEPALAQLGRNIDHANLEVVSQSRSILDMLQDTKERSFWGTAAVLVIVIIVLLWI